MKGELLNYDPKTAVGIISGDDGTRYSFKGVEFNDEISLLFDGAKLDFEMSGQEAKSVYLVKSESMAYPNQKSKIAVGLLAIFVGGIGVHKFYLGHIVPGVIMLLIGVFGWVLVFIPNLILGVIALIEGIIYLTRTDQQFHDTYVVKKKVWF